MLYGVMIPAESSTLLQLMINSCGGSNLIRLNQKINIQSLPDNKPCQRETYVFIKLKQAVPLITDRLCSHAPVNITLAAQILIVANCLGKAIKNVAIGNGCI